MKYVQQHAGRTSEFDGLIELLAKASPHRSGDVLAGCAADSDLERMAARWALADVELGPCGNRSARGGASDASTRRPTAPRLQVHPHRCPCGPRRGRPPGAVNR
ncbi:ethanolamine ammonia-lyase subunit EutB [Streptomyces sp. NPDC005349]|uniref:ethanolamine ammonia-lyase subunit EutB n=1 Tax=Streptomyces sp. NPDC005349 TaxID=3157037 RepID=UPI0033A3D834